MYFLDECNLLCLRTHSLAHETDNNVIIYVALDARSFMAPVSTTFTTFKNTFPQSSTKHYKGEENFNLFKCLYNDEYMHFKL